MRSRFVRVTNGVDFYVVRKVFGALEEFRRYFTMSKANDLSPKKYITLFSIESKHWKHMVKHIKKYINIMQCNKSLAVLSGSGTGLSA